MSILIQGMEMPECCQDCTFCDFETDYEGDGYYVCHAIPRQIIPSSSERQEDCPLIPVPPHGRLIDADELHEELCALEYVRENEWLDGVREARGVDAARVALLDAPTIIPADKEERDADT